MSIKNVVLVGASGNLGPHVLKGLLDENFNVKVLARKASTSSASYPAHVSVYKITDDYPYNELVEAFTGQDAVISTIGAQGTKTQTRMVDAAIEAGVKRFIPAEFGSGATTAEARAHINVFANKKVVIDYLRSKEGTGLTWTGVVNGAFIPWGLESGFLQFDLVNKKALVLGSGDIKWTTSTMRNIGEATARVLRNLERNANRYVYIQSLYVSQNEVLAQLEQATGAKWTVEKRDAHAFEEESRKLAAAGSVAGIYSMVWAHIQEGDEFHKEADFVNDLLGLTKENLADVVAMVVKP